MKARQIAITVIFLVAVFLMPVLFALNQIIVLDSKYSIEMFEKRTPSMLPTPLETTIGRWPVAMEEYFRDHLPLRHDLIQLNSSINYDIFNTTTSTKIVIGEDGWLFLNDEREIKNISDYQGIVPMDEQELNMYADNLTSFAQRQAAAGRETVLFIVPNKEQIYGRYMPPGIDKINEMSRTDILIEHIAKQDTPMKIADPKQRLMEEGEQNERLYFLTDSHWTPEGCFVGLEVLLETLGVTSKPYNSEEFLLSDTAFSGGLGGLGALFNIPSEPHYRYQSEYVFSSENIMEGTADQIQVYYSDAPDERRVLFLGDSFRNEATNQLSDSFATVGYADYQIADIDLLIESFDPDIIVIEQVERNIFRFEKPI